MTHILHLIDLLQVGGAQKMISSFACEAISQGIEVSVVSLMDVSGKIPAEELKAMGVSVTAFPARHLVDLRRIIDLVKFMRSRPFDLVQTHLTYGNILGGLAGRLAGLPVVATLHSAGNDQNPSDVNSFTSSRSRAETFTLRHFAAKVMAVGQSVAQAQQARLGEKPIVTIANAVPRPPLISKEERQELRRGILVDEKQKLLISVGRFAVVKELPDLVAAFQKVKDLHPDTKLVIIGDGTERALVEKRIVELNLSRDVILTGRQSNVSDWLQTSDLYVSASSLEGMPISILEAMAVGLPVVATEVGDIPQVVLPGMGFLVPPHHPDRLAEAICTLLDQPDLRQAMGKAAFAHVALKYNVSNWFIQIMTLYAQVLKRNVTDLLPEKVQA